MTYAASYLLHRCDPAHNMARFYRLSLQADLFGGVRMERVWGRIGSHGQSKIAHFASQEEASLALNTLLRRKYAKGYEAITYM
ncbi:MAG: WGR domain-containing protein [Cohaesibacter sp.]|nr:WGR domain-containing protein [Cohaesibacter sp.]MCV6600298.1 WGR domain-containing protein [Cohaesibacter sp.]